MIISLLYTTTTIIYRSLRSRAAGMKVFLRFFYSNSNVSLHLDYISSSSSSSRERGNYLLMIEKNIWPGFFFLYQSNKYYCNKQNKIKLSHSLVARENLRPGVIDAHTTLKRPFFSLIIYKYIQRIPHTQRTRVVYVYR